jgi:hypothetical protein
MFKLFILQKGLDGEGTVNGATPYDLLLQSSAAPSVQIYCGSSASVAAAKTVAGNIFKATLAWTDTGTTASVSAVFTT